MAFKGIIILIALFVFLLFFYIWILPHKRLMTLYTPDGRKMCVRRGYRRQWDNLNPMVYVNGGKVTFAKHPCFKLRKYSRLSRRDNSEMIIIDSPVPLTVKGNKDTSLSNIHANAGDSYGKYPESLVLIYGNTLSGRLDKLQDSNTRWVRLRLYRLLKRLVFLFKRHYYYWGTDLEGLAYTPRLRKRSFLLEYSRMKGGVTSDDRWLNTYYQGNYPAADVLICCENSGGRAVWDVYQLCSNRLLGGGIGTVKHLIHYQQKTSARRNINAVRKKLKKAIRAEMGLKRIVFVDSIALGIDMQHFKVMEAKYMAYICLVENTEEEKCQVLYSPLTDSECTEKNVVIDACTVSRLVWTSLIPFTSKKNRPGGDVANCESQNIIREGTSCQKTLTIRNNTIEFDHIRFKSERTI